MSTETITAKAWLTTTEAAHLLGKNPTTIWKWAHSGTIPPHFLLRSGSHTYIARAWVLGEQTR